MYTSNGHLISEVIYTPRPDGVIDRLFVHSAHCPGCRCRNVPFPKTEDRRPEAARG